MNLAYFFTSSLLFFLACQVAGEVADHTEKMNRWMPAHLQRAFEAGCNVSKNSKLTCEYEANKFRREQDRIYN